jgi:asparagine synthase (glutamine-hydrolysing)
MCGIAGIISPKITSDELRKRIASMQSQLRHRGPDDEGIYVDAGSQVALAHTRLAIIDLSAAGHQPMSSPDGRYTITFNGEIYNFLELRQELLELGEHFQSRTDTEVILKLYAREGSECVKRLEGMFAFAIWDRLQRRCFLARDPLGIKPLYLWRQRETLAFASEVLALLKADVGPKSLCDLGLQEYLLYGSVQEPRTLIDEIEALPAGYTLDWAQGSARRERYWQLKFGSAPASEEEVTDLTRKALDDSIRRHFVSDVPVGIFLSGGIDSTAIVALAKANGYERLQTLCISFDDPAYDEGSVAARTAAHFGTEHHDWRMTAENGRQLLEEFLDHTDQPSNDGFNTFCVSKMARECGLKVVLSGLGGDELFGSYSSFSAIPKMTAWHKRLNWVPLVRASGGRLGERLAKSQRLRRAGTYLQSSGSVADAYWAVRGFFTPKEAKQLVPLYTGKSHYHRELGCLQEDVPNQPTVADEISYLEMTRYMRNQLLRDGDVMSMACGLELRVPLADRTLVDAVAQIPARQRMAKGKRLLLDAVGDIPPWVVDQPKRGFRFPFSQWMSHDWRDIFDESDLWATPQLKTWYRHWSLFMLNRFIRMCGLPAN